MRNHKNTSILFIVCLFFFISNKSSSQTINFLSNTKHDSIRCTNNQNHIYSIYLPPIYTPQKTLPVIFIIDPMGRASYATDKFLNAAKKHNYIIVSSYNSKNGSFDQLKESINILINDVLKKFKINGNRIYIAGFSGGSRAALALASYNNAFFQGVIGCGAGFPSNTRYIPNKLSKFVYYGIIGDKDMNFLDVKKLEKHLSRFEIAHRIRYYEGKHTWPDEKLLTEAVAWLELQAINKRFIFKNYKFTNEFFKQSKLLAANYLQKEHYIDAIRTYGYIIRDFETHFKTCHFEITIDSIQSLNKYQNQLKEDQRDFNNENKLICQINENFKILKDNDKFSDIQLKWWHAKIDSLNKNNKSFMAQRILALIHFTCSEYGSSQTSLKQYKKALNFYSLWAILSPENKYAHFYLARTYAFLSKHKKSLESLRRSIELGIKINESLISQDEAFKKLKNNKKFKKIFMSKKYQ